MKVLNFSVVGILSRVIPTVKYYSYSEYSSRAGKVFASPTYNNTFKMLCLNKEHPEIIKSILNSFLNLNGKDKISQVSFSTTKKFPQSTEDIDKGDTLEFSSSYLENSSRFAVDSTIDLLCTTENKKQIAIEMQQAHEDYFLARSQLYMSKLIASQVKVGQSSKAHEVMLNTYIICIGKENIIRDKNILTKQKEYLTEPKKQDLSFELTVTPTIHDLYITIEDNKMTWKFFELNKFKELMKHIKIDKDSPIKYQWMKFLLKCQDEESTPEDIADIIKEGYQIMEMANWTPLQKALYDMEIDSKELALTKIKTAELKGEAKGKAEGIAEGEAKGIVIGEAKSIKKSLQYKESDEVILNDHKGTLTAPKLATIKALPQPPELGDITKILLSNEYSTEENQDAVEITGENHSNAENAA